jgi:tRNA(Arg) A34 adenosine deaminase TadA
MAAADARFMREAIEIAHIGVRAGQSPFGACVVRDGRVLARAHNTVLRDSDPSAHAEINAVRAACAELGTHDLSGCIVYATGEPCPMCLGCCYWAHVPRIVFGSSLADSEAIGFGELPYAPATLLNAAARPLLVEGGVLRDECLGIFKAWQARGGRDTY